MTSAASALRPLLEKVHCPAAVPLDQPAAAKAKPSTKEKSAPEAAVKKKGAKPTRAETIQFGLSYCDMIQQQLTNSKGKKGKVKPVKHTPHAFEIFGALDMLPPSSVEAITEALR